MALSISVEELDRCQFHSWYLSFRSNTIKSKIIPLPEDFISWLLEARFFSVPNQILSYSFAGWNPHPCFLGPSPGSPAIYFDVTYNSVNSRARAIPEMMMEVGMIRRKTNK